MNRFINALKQNIIISQIAQDIDITDDNFKDYVQKLKDVVFDVSVPIYYSPWINNIESIYISNFNELTNSSEVDYSGINGYTKLKTLIITHNNNIKKLNISNLQNLENLIIVDNKNLNEINGLSGLRHLNKIIIVGNNIKEVDDINSYAYNTKKSQMNILDVNMYHYLHREKFDVSNSNINFAEKVSVGELYILNQSMMQELYNNATSIIHSLIKQDMNDLEKTMVIYKYIVSNLSYDYENLNKRNEYVKTNEIKIYDNTFKDINTSYKALKNKKVVCEGYANLFKFLLNIVGIEARNVKCFIKNDNRPFVFYDHVASKVKIDNKWYYCDSQLETDPSNLIYFMKGLGEFSKTHELPVLAKKYRSK